MCKQDLKRKDIVLYYETELESELDWIPVYDDYGYADDEAYERVVGAELKTARLAIVTYADQDNVGLDFMNGEAEALVSREQVYRIPDANQFILNYIGKLLEPTKNVGNAYQKNRVLK